jgi:hypothetical protein
MEDIKSTPVAPTTTEQEVKVEKPVVEKQEDAPKKDNQELIDSIVEKRLARETEKWTKKLEEERRLAQLSEEERKAELTKQYETELSERETKLKIAENKLSYTKKFESDGLPTDMIDYIVDADPEIMESKYSEFKMKWNENLNKQLEAKVKPTNNPTAFNVNQQKPKAPIRVL